MFDLLVWSTAGMLVMCILIAHQRCRDPLHPMIMLGMFFGYACFWQPFILDYQGLLDHYLQEESMIEFVQFVYLAGISAFCFGCLSAGRRTFVPGIDPDEEDQSPIAPYQVMRVNRICWFFGIYGVLAYMIQLKNAGGFVSAYSHRKGGGWAASGYIGDGPLLTIAAIVLYFLVNRKARLKVGNIIVILIFAMPNLIIGFLGTRRGPLTQILVTLLLCVFMLRDVRVSLRNVVIGLLGSGIVVFAVFSHRSDMYIGSEVDFDHKRTLGKFAPSEIDTGNDYLMGAGEILTAYKHSKHAWGKRIFVHLFIRPIPKQIWPTKYEAMGLGEFNTTNPNLVVPADWASTVGWVPQRGSAPGCIVDLFLELRWGSIPAMYLLGLFFGWCWTKARFCGGVWIAIYIEALSLAVYLPTQSIVAWLYRFLFTAIPTYLAWYYFVDHPTVRARLNDQAALAGYNRLPDEPGNVVELNEQAGK